MQCLSLQWAQAKEWQHGLYPILLGLGTNENFDMKSCCRLEHSADRSNVNSGLYPTYPTRDNLKAPAIQQYADRPLFSSMWQPQG